MEFIIVAIIVLISLFVLKQLYGYHKKEIKRLEIDEKRDELSEKYPDNITLCKIYLKKLNHENVKIEENKENKASLYIAATNKIIIANITDTYSRIQTIAHECLHAIQDRKILMFNFIFSNIYLLFFAIICILGAIGILPYKMMFITILMITGLIYYSVRMYLEHDAMIKARYLAKEYLEEAQISSKEEIDDIVAGFDNLNDIGIKCINYYMFSNVMIKVLIFSIICILR